MAASRRDEIISATDLARNLSTALHSVITYAKEKITLFTNNKLEAVIIDIEEYERLKEAYDPIEHMEIAKLVEARSKIPKEKYVNLEEATQTFGIDIDEL